MGNYSRMKRAVIKAGGEFHDGTEKEHLTSLVGTEQKCWHGKYLGSVLKNRMELLKGKRSEKTIHMEGMMNRVGSSKMPGIP